MFHEVVVGLGRMKDGTQTGQDGGSRKKIHRGRTATVVTLHEGRVTTERS